MKKNKRLLAFIKYAIGQKYAEPQKHELRVGRWLKEVGYSSREIEYQPNGSLNPPDWFVFDREEWISVECKTSKKAKPSFFDSYPDPNTLYVYSDLKYNDTTVFYGSDIFSKKLIKLYEEIHFNPIKKIESRNKDIFLNDKNNPFGFRPGFRPCWKQCGTEGRTNFFKEETRSKLEAKAKRRAS